MDGLTIGQVARRAQVNIETMRYYERQGLLQEPPRTALNYRSYPKDAVRCVRYVGHARKLLREALACVGVHAWNVWPRKAVSTGSCPQCAGQDPVS